MHALWYWASYGFSVIFHPAIMPTFVVFILFLAGFPMFTSDEVYVYMILKTLLITGVIPGLSIYSMFRMGFIESLHMRNRQERMMPFIMMSIFYVFIVVLYSLSNQTGLEFILIMSGIAYSVLAVTAITTVHKISVHTVGASGMCGIFFGLQVLYPALNLMYPILFAISVTGAIMSARLYMQAHTPLETLTGVLVGFGTCFGVFLATKFVLGV